MSNHLYESEKQLIKCSISRLRPNIQEILSYSYNCFPIIYKVKLYVL